jgi:hypothetical protein
MVQLPTWRTDLTKNPTWRTVLQKFNMATSSEKKSNFLFYRTDTSELKFNIADSIFRRNKTVINPPLPVAGRQLRLRTTSNQISANSGGQI